MASLHVTLSGEPPMPPPDADLGIEIDFVKGEGNPRRVFDAASLLIAGFERFDQAAIATIDTHIEPLLVLEDVEAGSLRIWLRNVLRATDDEALKGLDWKPLVGMYLVRAKYAGLRWLDDPERPGLTSLVKELKTIAEETDVRHLPDYAPIDEGRLLEALGKVQSAKKQLGPGDKLLIEAEGETYQTDLTRDWSPGEIASSAPGETDSHVEMILTVRKPDMIGKSMWQFRHGKFSLSAPIKDERWLSLYHHREIPVLPGDAIRCLVRMVYRYNEQGDLTDQRIEIEKVYEVIPKMGRQLNMRGL